MILQKTLEFSMLIAAFNIFGYSIAFLNLFLTFVFEFFEDAENKEDENSDHRYSFYLSLYKIILLIFSFIMIITSINLLRGISKKSISLFNSWLILSFCVLAYQVTFLLDQLLLYFAYGYTACSPVVLLGLFTIFGIHIFCIKKIIISYMDLYRENILQREQISTIKNSTFNSQNYMRHLIENDPSILAPLNQDELIKQHKKSISVNLTDFEI